MGISISSGSSAPPAFTSKTMLDFLTNTTDNFGGRTFIVAVHEEHPFVFFDCDHVLAICGYSTQNGGSEACGVRQNAMDPVQCTDYDEEDEEAQGEYSVQMVIALPYSAPNRNSSIPTNMSVTSFDLIIEAKVKEALARAVHKPSGALHVKSVTDPASEVSSAYGEHRRRLLSAPVQSHLDFSIAAEGAADARAIALQLTVSGINAHLQHEGLSNMTSIIQGAKIIEPAREDYCTTEFPEDLSSSTPSNQLPQWACGRESDGQGAGKFRKGKEHGGCDPQDKYYPFCGITIEIMDAVCMVRVRFRSFLSFAFCTIIVECPVL